MPPSLGGQALRRVPQDKGQRRGFSRQPGASCHGKRDALGCGHRTAWISALSWPSMTVLWLAGHAGQPVLRNLLCGGLSCGDLGRLPEIRHGCGVPQPPQQASCCRWLKPQGPAPRGSAHSGGEAWAINQGGCFHPRRISGKNKIKIPQFQNTLGERAGGALRAVGEARAAAAGDPNYRVPNYRVPGHRATCQLRRACLPGRPTVVPATSFPPAAGQKYRPLRPNGLPHTCATRLHLSPEEQF